MDTQGKYFMIVDDDSDDRKLFCWTLAKATQEITCLGMETGKMALDYLEDESHPLPELIFLDINMPVMTGWIFLSKRRSIPRLQNIPIIMFSTSAHQRDVNIAYDMGAIGYCVKPDDPSDLKQIFTHLCSKLDKGLNMDVLRQSDSSFFRFPDTADHLNLK